MTISVAVAVVMPGTCVRAFASMEFAENEPVEQVTVQLHETKSAVVIVPIVPSVVTVPVMVYPFVGDTKL